MKASEAWEMEREGEGGGPLFPFPAPQPDRAAQRAMASRILVESFMGLSLPVAPGKNVMRFARSCLPKPPAALAAECILDSAARQVNGEGRAASRGHE